MVYLAAIVLVVLLAGAVARRLAEVRRADRVAELRARLARPRGPSSSAVVDVWRIESVRSLEELLNAETPAPKRSEPASRPEPRQRTGANGTE